MLQFVCLILSQIETGFLPLEINVFCYFKVDVISSDMRDWTPKEEDYAGMYNM